MSILFDQNGGLCIREDFNPLLARVDFATLVTEEFLRPRYDFWAAGGATGTSRITGAGFTSGLGDCYFLGGDFYYGTFSLPFIMDEL